MGVNSSLLRFLYLIREKARLGEKHSENIVEIAGTLKQMKGRCSPTCLPLELFSWLTKGLYQTVSFKSASDDLLYGVDKEADQL